MVQQKVDVAILMITYKHEAFIAQAIRGVLEQNTTFSYHLFIGDDASPDNTYKVIEHYIEAYPDKITYRRFDQNRGMMQNFSDLFFRADAKYIAMCEGDDYWCYEHKLQRQVDFLEANHEYSFCFHQVYELKNNNNQLSLLNTSNSEQTYSINDLAKGNFIYTPSVVFRNGLIKLPHWFNQLSVGDYVLHMLNARHGVIKYFPEPMAVYRLHEGGTWSNRKMESKLYETIVAVNFLISSDFECDTVKLLIDLRRHYVVTYLNLLMKQEDWKDFIERLAIFSKEDDYIGQKWLLEYYPAYIKRIEALQKAGFKNSVCKIFRRLRNNFKKYF